jgi:hypothetical protein
MSSTVTGMNAETTARRALTWAASAGSSHAAPVPAAGPPPSGPLRDPGSLARPAQETLALLGKLVRDSGARLGAGRPPFGDHGAAGLGAILLAAAAGGRMEFRQAQRLAELIPPPQLTSSSSAPGAWLDALARHVVVAPWLTVTGAPTDTLLRSSPLTAVLHRPAADDEGMSMAKEIAVAVAMLSRPRGAEVLRGTLSRWAADPVVLGWRTSLLRRLSQGNDAEQRFTADGYVTALVKHGAQWRQRWQEAGRNLAGQGRPDDLMVATVAYWAPLADLAGRDPDLIRQRRVLAGAADVLGLVRRHRLGTTGGGR